MDYIYVDNSNLYIEGRRVSAVASGLASNITEAMSLGILDHGYTISFGKLHQFLTGNDLSKIKRAALYGSRPPPNDSIWQYAAKAGFELHLEDRNYANKEKKIDTGIATLMTKDAYKHGKPTEDVFVLVAGDKDYVPTLNELRADGYNVEVVFWNHAAQELKDAATKFIALDGFWTICAYKRYSGLSLLRPIMELLITLLIGIAWPVAVVWIAYLFKSELRSLMERISHLKIKDIEAKFERGLAEAEEEVITIEKSSPSVLPRPEITSKLESLRRIADISPRAAILEAWVLIEEAAGKAGFVQGASIPRVNPHLFVEELIHSGKLPEGSSTLLGHMRRLRNQAAHLPDFSINQDEADRYLQLAARMSELILNVNKS